MSQYIGGSQVRIPLIGGPHDGLDITLPKAPIAGDVMRCGHHFYEFNLGEWQYEHYQASSLVLEKDGQTYCFVYGSQRHLSRLTGRMIIAGCGFNWNDAAAILKMNRDLDWCRKKVLEHWYAERQA